MNGPFLGKTTSQPSIIYFFMFQEHSRFVQAVRFSPNGNFFASAGFDGKVFLYDGASADFVSEVGSPAHKGGVYGVRNYYKLLQFYCILMWPLKY